MKDQQTVAVIGASDEAFDHVRRCLVEWNCVKVPPAESGIEAASLPASVSLILLYARKVRQQTMAVCQRIRKPPESSDAPILLVISRYMMDQASAARRMGNASFVIAPFDQTQVRAKVAEFFEACEAGQRGPGH